MIEELWQLSVMVLEQHFKLAPGQFEHLERLCEGLTGPPGVNVDDTDAVDHAIRQLRTAAMVLQKIVEDGLLPQHQLILAHRTLQNTKTVANRLLFGSRLRTTRNARGCSVVSLAITVGVDRSYISKLETAAAGPPDIEVIGKLADALGVPLSEFVVDAIRPFDFRSDSGAAIRDTRLSLIRDIARECEAIPEEYLELLLAQVKAVAQAYRQRRSFAADK